MQHHAFWNHPSIQFPYQIVGEATAAKLYPRIAVRRDESVPDTALALIMAQIAKPGKYRGAVLGRVADAYTTPPAAKRFFPAIRHIFTTLGVS